MERTHQPMHCDECGYDLVGLPPGPCPECARPFDPEDPATWTTRHLPRWRRVLASRWTAYIAVTVIGFLAMYHTILPRPYVAWNGTIDPMLWVWFEQPFGVERRNRGRERLNLYWWAGTLVRARHTHVVDLDAGGDPDYAVTWDLRRSGDRWRLSVLEPDVASGPVLTAFNTMRDDDELFGVRLVGDTERRNEAPFEARGLQEDVLEAILRAYALDVSPMLITEQDEDLWVFSEEAGLERIGVDEAEARGIEYEVIGSMNVSRFGLAR